MGEQPDAKILERALAHPPDEVGLGVGGHGVEHRRGQERRDDNVERAHVVVPDPVIDRQLGQRRRRQRGARGGHERDEHGQDTPAIRSQQLSQAAQLASPA